MEAKEIEHIGTEGGKTPIKKRIKETIMSDNKEECDMNLRHQDLEKPESQEKLIEIMNRVDNKFGIFAVHGILPKESGVTEETILNSPETMKVIEAVQPSMIADRKKVIYEESDEEILKKHDRPQVLGNDIAFRYLKDLVQQPEP